MYVYQKHVRYCLSGMLRSIKNLSSPNLDDMSLLFEFMIKECDDYETYIKKNDIKNGVIEASITEIRRRYLSHIQNVDFADYVKVQKQIGMPPKEDNKN